MAPVSGACIMDITSSVLEQNRVGDNKSRPTPENYTETLLVL